MDVIAALINALPDHATLVLPAQAIRLLEAGRPMTLLPALRNAATSMAVFGNRGEHWSLYIGDLLTLTLYFHDNLGDRPGRKVPTQASMLSEWLALNASDGEEWTAYPSASPG